jgi:hypothetical protein
VRRQELAEQLERLGSLPTPLPDPRRVYEWERELYREFVVPPPSTGRSAVEARARRQRRQVLVGGIAVLAAASTTALVLHRQSGHPFELDAASGAVLLLPDGSTHPLHAGDHVPAGGIIHTGPDGTVTIKGTKVGPSQAVLVDDGRLVLLPAPTPSTAPPQSQPATTASTPTSARAAPPARGTTSPPATMAATAPPATPAKTASPSSVSPETAALISPAPQQAVTVAALQLTIARAADGIRLSWTTTDAATFERYVVVRGTAETTELTVLAEFPDRQITSFTDPAAPQNADLVYRVLALDVDGRPVAMSPTAMLEIGASSSSTTTTEPATSEPPPPDTTVPPDTAAPVPPPTDTSPTDAPPTAIHRHHRPPPTTAAATG